MYKWVIEKERHIESYTVVQRFSQFRLKTYYERVYKEICTVIHKLKPKIPLEQPGWIIKGFNRLRNTIPFYR